MNNDVDLIAHATHGPAVLTGDQKLGCLPWYTPRGSEILRTGDLAQILRFYRWFHGIGQDALAALTGYDRTYISHLETGRRRLKDHASLLALAKNLDIPSRVLGVCESGQADYTDMLRFGGSTVRLAVAAREAGRPADALAELHPLVAVLDRRVREGNATRQDLTLLASAYVELGVALGDLLPEEHLSAAARWAGVGASIADSLQEPLLLAHALAMYGNELRKASALHQAITTLERALSLSKNQRTRGTTAVLLARAASESGDAATFDRSLDICHTTLAHNDAAASYFLTPFSLREVELRGHLITGRPHRASRAAQQAPNRDAMSATWNVMEQITMGQYHLSQGDTKGASSTLSAAIREGQMLRLPHQIQRAIRLARSSGLDDVAHEGSTSLICLTSRLIPDTDGAC